MDTTDPTIWDRLGVAAVSLLLAAFLISVASPVIANASTSDSAKRDSDVREVIAVEDDDDDDRDQHRGDTKGDSRDKTGKSTRNDRSDKTGKNTGNGKDTRTGNSRDNTRTGNNSGGGGGGGGTGNSAESRD